MKVCLINYEGIFNKMLLEVELKIDAMWRVFFNELSSYSNDYNLSLVAAQNSQRTIQSFT
jgi:hypothetical protein